MAYNEIKVRYTDEGQTAPTIPERKTIPASPAAVDWVSSSLVLEAHMLSSNLAGIRPETVAAEFGLGRGSDREDKKT